MEKETKEPIPIIIIYGPTSSGKTELSIKLAKKFNGEIISADSRQVYKHLDIVTGKVTKTEMKNIPHYLLDVADPRKDNFTAFEFVQMANRAIEKIISKGKIPIIAGGTMFYISALLQEVNLPNIPANPQLRAELELKTTQELFKMLQKLHPARAKTIEPHNKRRIIRALEIATSKPNTPSKNIHLKSKYSYAPIKLGIQIDKSLLRERIRIRVQKRLRAGMVAEARNMHKKGLTYKRMRELGMGMAHLADFLQNKIDKETLIWRIERDEWRYAKRQLAWWSKDKDIKWIPYNKPERFIQEAKQALEEK